MDPDSTTAVRLERTLPVAADAVFAVLADPARHPEIDGSGMVLGAVDPRPLTAVGQTFTMSMHNPWNGDYRTVNEVVEFTPGRHVTWATAREGQPASGFTWSWTVDPADDGHCRVTHVYDWSAVTDPAVLARVQFPRVQPDQLATTIDRLARAAAGTSDVPGDRTGTRAELLPEEAAFDVQDPAALASELLAESDARTGDPDAGHSGTAQAPSNP